MKKFKYNFSHHFKSILNENTTVEEFINFTEEWIEENGKSELYIVYSCDDYQFMFMSKLIDRFQEGLKGKTIITDIKPGEEYIIKEIEFLNYTLYNFIENKLLLVNTPRNYILKFNENYK